MKRLAHWALAHPHATLALLAGVTLFFAIGALRVQTDVGYRALLGRSHPTVQRFDAFLERFDGGFRLAALFVLPACVLAWEGCSRWRGAVV